jgi:hypothetical protein
MITAVVSGSFKFKPEIDKAIETLEETGITVLGPAKGWLIMPSLEIAERLRYGYIRPLPTEEKLTPRQIEDRFLRALGRANLMYLRNQEGYVGNSAAFEIGYALSKDKPMYALEPLDYEAMEIDAISMQQMFSRNITILPPEMVSAHYNENFSK